MISSLAAKMRELMAKTTNKSKRATGASAKSMSKAKPAKGAAGGSTPARVPENRLPFTKGVVQALSKGEPGEYYDTRSEAGLGLRVGKSGKATYFVRFQHGGINYNSALGSVPGSPSFGKALPPMQLDGTRDTPGARDAARLRRSRIENPADIEQVVSLGVAFYDYVENRRISKGKQMLPLSVASKRGYIDPFERYLSHVYERDYRTFGWREWEKLRNEALTGERDGTKLMQKPFGRRKPKALTGSVSQTRTLFAALSGMYQRNGVANPITELRARSGFATPEPRTNSVQIPELPQFFSVLRSLNSRIACDFFLISTLTGFRRQAILKLERRALDFDAQTYSAELEMPGFKRSKPQVYPLCQWLIERVLRPRAVGFTRGPYLFPINARKPKTDALARDRSPNLEGCINALHKAFGRRITPNDARRTFASIGSWIGISPLHIARLTGHSVRDANEPRESTGERTTRLHYITVADEELVRDCADTTSAILECAGELPLSDLVRAKLARTYAEHLQALEALAINTHPERRTSDMSKDFTPVII
jgi:integrase